MTIAVANVLTTDTFGSWLTRTNTLATIATQNAVTVDSTGGGSLSTGNGYVNGFFGANTVVAFTGIAGGSLAAGNTLNLLTNTVFGFGGTNVVMMTANASTTNVVISSNAVTISAVNGNTRISGNFLNVNASTTNVTSTSLNANSVVTITGNTTLKANSSFNILTITGNTSAAVLLANTSNTTFVGNVAMANSLVVNNSILVNNLANVNQLNVYGAVTSNIAGNLRVEGSVSIGGTFSYTGSANGDLIPATTDFFRLGNTSQRWADVWSNNVYATTTNTVSLIVTGNTSFANSLIPAANVTHSVGSSALYWSQAFVANTNSNNIVVSNNLFVPAGTAAAPAVTFTGNTDTGLFRSATATVGIAAAGTQKMTVNATTVAVNAAITVTGNATFSNTIAVTGNATFSNTVSVAGVATLSSNVATPGTLILNSIAHQFANSFTFANSTTIANVDTVSASLYRSYEYTVQLSDATTSPPRFQLTKLLLVHDGSTPYLTEYGTIFNSSQMGLFDATIGSGNIALQLTPTSANVVVRFVRTGIV